MDDLEHAYTHVGVHKCYTCVYVCHAALREIIHDFPELCFFPPGELYKRIPKIFHKKNTLLRVIPTMAFNSSHLTFCLANLLAFYLAFYLTFYLAFYLADLSGILSVILTGFAVRRSREGSGGRARHLWNFLAPKGSGFVSKNNMWHRSCSTTCLPEP